MKLNKSVPKIGENDMVSEQDVRTSTCRRRQYTLRKNCTRDRSSGR
jgi:hypothetical protein